MEVDISFFLEAQQLMTGSELFLCSDAISVNNHPTCYLKIAAWGQSIAGGCVDSAAKAPFYPYCRP